MLIRVLGPFSADVAGGAADLGGHRQKAVLALLVSAGGAVVSVDRMIDDLWRGEAPPRAIASLQAYVSNLRRVLEPDRERRAPARTLISAPPGYALRVPPDAVDAWRFESLLTAARAAAATEPGRARLQLRAALELWQGGAYAEFAEESWAQPAAARLEELRLAARELLLDVTLRTGGAAEAVAEAEVLTRHAPLREEAWRLLALSLWSTGRQADALAALRRARGILADELGLDPGAALVELEAAILGQRVELLDGLRTPDSPGPAAAEGVRATDSPGPAAVEGVRATDSPGPAAVEGVPAAGDGVRAQGGAGVARPADHGEVFVGRQQELAALAGAAAEAVAAGPRIALLSGEAGVGKTSVLGRFRQDLLDGGWLVAVGRCPEVDGAPPAWAWVEALRQLADVAPPGDLGPALAPLLEDARSAASGDDTDVAAGRFRLHRAVRAWLARAAAARPVAIVLDDLHAADAETLLLLASAAELTDAPVLLVAALRPADNPERLAETMAVLARRSPVRVHLDGLGPDEVQRLVGAFADVDAGTVAALAERTGGNPFYVRESARLLASEGALVATSEVPEGVRDVLRRRLSRLPQPAVAVLRLAAVVGREADVETLVEAADADEGAVLDALEAGLIAGLLTEPAPGRVRFVHGLVRDTMYTDLSQLRRTRMHARVAACTRRLRPDDYPALAHHYARAASSDTAVLAVDYAVRAAELAERRYAYDAAVELLTGAVRAADTVPGDRDQLRVDLLGRLLRAQAKAGAVAQARQTRDRALDVAVAAGREELLIAAFTAWNVPTPWQIRTYGVIDHRVVDLLGRLLRKPDLDPETRVRLLDALTNELDGEHDPRGVAAGLEAYALAPSVPDPAVQALGLVARARTMRFDLEAGERAAVAAQLRDLARAHGMVAYEWVAEQALTNCAAVRNDAVEVRARTARQGVLATAYQLPEPEAINLSGRAALAHIAGDYAEARRLYDEAYAVMRRQGSLHADGFHFIATSSLLISRDRFGEHLAQTRAAQAALGPIADDALALSLAAAGRLDEARAVPIGAYRHRPDYFESAFMAVRGLAAVAVGRADLAPAVIEGMLPVRDQIAGMSSTALAMRPVAYVIARLYELLGDRERAVEHFALARTVAAAWDAGHWVADAERGLDALGAR
ncbi:AAA family ATPase [Dactylosporangium aurantiacum]|uniref:AAA family ATPase n=1 Tax=Dactylosporangium aurantiacum TaxID=35754 RepID=A0A9Q9IIG1_9ACTN|nr:BTAD domain-containing putative transcriptional regulator [Dactylosporangium aurantiacum]MDG6108083.1 BTAD domain-containing putative transcriptional regulator [Dactylosporangium aurantiacum]UWZ53713.1 AAA family ATPase [Dactylosporangium aurantiacum]